MDAERVRAYLRGLPHVVETMQWGANLVYWVGDKAIGGRMFCLVNLDGDGKAVASFAAGAERYAELVERDGLSPAPYFARIFWVAAERWDAMRAPEWEAELAAAYALTLARLPRRTRDSLTMPAPAREKSIADPKKPPAQRKKPAMG